MLFNIYIRDVSETLKEVELLWRYSYSDIKQNLVYYRITAYGWYLFIYLLFI